MILANPMTKMNSKKIFLVIIVCLASLYSSQSVLALGGIDPLMKAKDRAEGFKDDAAAKGICLRIDEILDKIDGRMQQKETQVETGIQDKLQVAENDRDKRDQDLTEFRLEADEWREESYAKLEDKAATPEQEEAVEKFKVAIEAAVKARRDAIDTAIDTFRDGVDQAHSDQKASIDEVMNAYRNTVRTTLEKAKTDCENGVDEGTIRANIKTSLQAGKDQLKTDKTGVGKLQETMKTLIDAKKAAFEKAITDFKTAVQDAVTEMKKAFPES